METIKKIPVIILLLITVNLYSQVEKPITRGNWLIGGSASGEYSSYKSESDITSYLKAGIYPSIGYFIIDGMAVGVSISPNYSTRLGDNSYSYFSCGLGPFVKYYASSGLFLGGYLNYNTGIQSSKYFNSFTDKYDTNKYHSYSMSFSPEMGYAYFINSKIAIEASLNYSYNINLRSSGNNSEIGDIKWNSTQNHLYFSLGFQMFW